MPESLHGCGDEAKTVESGGADFCRERTEEGVMKPMSSGRLRVLRHTQPGHRLEQSSADEGGALRVSESLDKVGPSRSHGLCSRQLTEEERIVLALVASGLNTSEVATCLARPPEAIRRAIGSALTRLGARSKLEAVTIALRRGLIDLSRQ